MGLPTQPARVPCLAVPHLGNRTGPSHWVQGFEEFGRPSTSKMGSFVLVPLNKGTRKGTLNQTHTDTHTLQYPKRWLGTLQERRGETGSTASFRVGFGLKLQQRTHHRSSHWSLRGNSATHQTMWPFCRYKMLRPASHPPDFRNFVGTAWKSGAVPPA